MVVRKNVLIDMLLVNPCCAQFKVQSFGLVS